LPQDSTYTPVIHAIRLGELLGVENIFLKNETVLPTSSTKDRMAFVSLAYLYECGVRRFCTSSTGNSSSSYAYAIKAYPEMHLFLFTAESFVTRVQYANHDQVDHFSMQDATFVDAFDYAGVFAKENQLVSERGFFNIGRREGLKLAFFEATDQIPEPIDWYVQAVSSAMGVYGTYKGAKELLGIGHIDRLPKLLCAQQEICSPMVKAFKSDCDAIQPEHIVAHPKGIAEAILRGDPSRAYPHVRKIVKESGGDFVSVTEEEIREARTLVEDLENVSPCFSASTAIAGFIKQVRTGVFPKNDTVMINLTGGDRLRERPKNLHLLERDNKSNWVRV
jgi:threonine synthase